MSPSTFRLFQECLLLRLSLSWIPRGDVAGEELPPCASRNGTGIVSDELSSEIRLNDAAGHLPTLIHRVIGAGGVVRGGYLVGFRRVEYDEIRVGSDGESPLLWQPERPCGVPREDPDEERVGESTAVTASS